MKMIKIRNYLLNSMIRRSLYGNKQSHVYNKSRMRGEEVSSRRVKSMKGEIVLGSTKEKGSITVRKREIHRGTITMLILSNIIHRLRKNKCDSGTTV